MQEAQCLHWHGVAGACCPNTIEAACCIQEPAVCRDEAHRLQQQLDQHRLAAAEAGQHAAEAQHALQEALEEQQAETRAAQAQASRLEAVRLAACRCPSWHLSVCWAGVGRGLKTQASASSKATTWFGGVVWCYPVSIEIATSLGKCLTHPPPCGSDSGTRCLQRCCQSAGAEQVGYLQKHCLSFCCA